MSLRYRIAFLFSVSVFIILLISSLFIFLLNDDFREKEFNKRLLSESLQSEDIFTDNAFPTKKQIRDLNDNANNSLQSEYIFIFDSTLSILYSSLKSKPPNLTPSFFEKVKKTGNSFFATGNREGVIHYSTEIKPHYIVVTAVDLFGLRKRDNLQLLLLTSVIGGLILSGMLVLLYVTQALKPLDKLRIEIEKIDEANLKQRISYKGSTEVAKIGKQFNAMLDRIEQAFEQRKSFVQHASHELRTPLTNMLLQTESALGKQLTPTEYNKVLLSLKEDQQDLIELINSLLALSQYQILSLPNEKVLLRLDEVLFQSTDFISQIFPDAVITVDFETVPENEAMLIINGNEVLMKSALQNLIKNAIQYSYNRKVKISISILVETITINFENKGKQLAKEEQLNMFIPFFRGENSIHKKGYGLGLSIVDRIIKLHKGTINYSTKGEDSNCFTITLPREKT